MGRMTMALIRKLERVSMERNSVHGEVPCTYTVFSDDQGEKYLQIDTYGSPARVLKNKKSQTIQFGPTAIRELQSILTTL